MSNREFQPHRNFEQLRYRLSEDIYRLYLKYEKTSERNGDAVINSVFAAVSSGLVTEGFSSSWIYRYRVTSDKNGMSLISDNVFNWKQLLLLLACYILWFGISYLLIAKVRKSVNVFVRKHFPDKGLGEEERKRTVVKQFDNFACDAIVEAYGHEEIFNQNLSMIMDLARNDDSLQGTDYERLERLIVDKGDIESLKILEQMKYAYYEILFNLQIAADKTKNLLIYKDTHIRTADQYNRENVDDFRVVNMCRLIKFLVDFLIENKNLVALNGYNIASLNGRISDLSEKSWKLLDDIKDLEEAKA